MARAALALLLIGSLGGQTPRLRTTVHLVIAPTTVTDRHGRNIDGLTDGDFRLLDNGARREVHVDYALVPISLVIAVQSSSFSAAALNKVRQAGSMIEPLVTGERGEVAVVSFDSEVLVVQQFTSDPEKLKKAFLRLEPGDEGGKMIDAVAEATRLLETRPQERRRVLLVFSETRDRGSKQKLEDTATAIQRANVTVYPVTYSAYATAFTARPGTTPPPSGAGVNIIAILRELGRMGKKNTAAALSAYTRGRTLEFVRQRGLEEAITRVGEELHSQYLLSFTVGDSGDASYHALQVSVEGRPDAVVRARPGYWLAGGQ